MAHLEGTFEIASWDEQPDVEIDGDRRLTTAKVTQTFHGGIEGTGSVVWTMAYRADGTATVLGIQRVEGTAGDAEGSFVAQTVGSFDGTVARGDWTVVEGLGTGAFAGITGTGSMEAPMDATPTFSLDYEPN